MTTLDPDEVELVRRLIVLFNAAFDHSHTRGCQCEVCDAIESAGECKMDTFDSLTKKVQQ